MASLDDLYELYCSVASDLQIAPAGSQRAALLQEKADELWLQYTDQGGGRQPWHRAGQPWQYHDGFVEMRHSSANGPVDQLRALLNLPRNVGPHYMASEQSAVEHFQEHHHLPATGVVDRKTWQAILKAKGERKQAELPRRFELPGTSEKPVPLVIRTRKRWKLALDDVPYRTFANQHNLAVLAEHAYVEPGGFKDCFEDKWNTDRLREDALAGDGGSVARLLLREAPATFRHEQKFIVNWDTSTQLYVVNSPEHGGRLPRHGPRQLRQHLQRSGDGLEREELRLDVRRYLRGEQGGGQARVPHPPRLRAGVRLDPRGAARGARKVYERSARASRCS